MKLKRLELIGFKSFAQKTSLEFLPGIVAIVGPNGSGKSNITDAVRWILGERESSRLRSAKIEDLIFAGTPKRAQMSLAQVSIHLDNSAGVLPVEFTDVAVTRKISRDGSSEFYLNDTRTRLRDIVDLLARARLGVRGIAVINQGASDVFLKASPNERREMIEEMLGLKEFRIKKNDAQNKLKNTEINLSKASALLDEIQPHLRSLRRQTKRWERREEVEAQLKSIEKDYFLRQLKKIYDTFSKTDKKLQSLNEQLQERQNELSLRRQKLEASESNQPEYLEELNVLRIEKNKIENSKAELVHELGKLEGKLEAIRQISLEPENIHEFSNNEDKIKKHYLDPIRARKLIDEIRNSLGDINSLESLEEVRLKINEIIAEIDDLFQISQDKVVNKAVPDKLRASKIDTSLLESDIAVINKSISELGEGLGNIIEKEEQLSIKSREANKSFQEFYRAVEESSGQVSEIESSIHNINLEKERAKVHLEDLQLRVQDAEWNFSDLEIALEGYEFLDFDFDVDRRMHKLRHELAAIGEIDESLLNEAKEVENRNTFLSTHIEDLTRAKEDLAKLIKDLDDQIHNIFSKSLKKINNEFQHFFKLMFGGGRAKLVLERKIIRKGSVLSEIGSEIGSSEDKHNTEVDEEQLEGESGIGIAVDLPRKKIKGIEMLSGGERSLVSVAALFALVAVSPPPFLVLDEVDAALDESNARRFANLLKDLSDKTQFIVVTHNRVTMESADALYGVTMGDDGVSKVLSLKLEQTQEHAT